LDFADFVDFDFYADPRNASRAFSPPLAEALQALQ